MSEAYSDFLVFVDESGDHSLESVNPEFPIFVLAFCIVSKEDYVSKAVPSLQRLKLEHFGHDQVVLHEGRSASGKAPSTGSCSQSAENGSCRG
ncbi:MAG TPA: DUF3800 domain-containing protein [Geothrix sp.]